MRHGPRRPGHLEALGEESAAFLEAHGEERGQQTRRGFGRGQIRVGDEGPIRYETGVDHMLPGPSAVVTHVPRRGLPREGVPRQIILDGEGAFRRPRVRQDPGAQLRERSPQLERVIVKAGVLGHMFQNTRVCRSLTGSRLTIKQGVVSSPPAGNPIVVTAPRGLRPEWSEPRPSSVFLWP